MINRYGCPLIKVGQEEENEIEKEEMLSQSERKEGVIKRKMNKNWVN